jgi:hypothetical protein
MATDNLHRREPAGRGERRVGERSPRPSITGPHAGYDRYGRLDHYYYRCERCGLEATDPALAKGCWRCGGNDREADA